MSKTSEEKLEITKAASLEDRPVWTPPTPVSVCEMDLDGERWDGLS